MTHYVILPKKPFETTQAGLQKIFAAHGNMSVVNCTDNMAVVDSDADTINAFKKAHRGWSAELETEIVPGPIPPSPFSA